MYRAVLENVEADLWKLVDEINMQRRFDTTKLAGRELTKALDEADNEAGSTDRTTRWEGETLVVTWPDKAVSVAVTDKAVKVTMGSAIDRIKAKALQARQIVPDAIKAVEGDLDGLIAQRATIDQKRTSAMAPHLEAIAGLKTELDQVGSALDILSNGGPELDPLPESNSSAHG